jgi:hypothetical protein
MLMHKNQKGFGHAGIILIIVVIGLVGLSGWFVWNKNKSADQKMTANTSQKDSAKGDEDDKTKAPYVKPENYTSYSKAELNFSLAYPTEWGPLEPGGSLGSLFNSQTRDNKSNNETNIGGRFGIFADTPEKFFLPIGYDFGTKVVQKNGEDVWVMQILDAFNDGTSTVKNGEDLSKAQQPKIHRSHSGVKVYEFSNGHAGGVWALLAFKSGDNFIGLKLPYYYPIDVHDDGTETSDPTVKPKYEAQVAEIIDSISHID